jgi:RNA-directed DNA polymerase
VESYGKVPEVYSKEYLQIRSLKHLSYRLGFPAQLLEEVSEKTEKYYKFILIQKPNGGVREISIISQPLKKIQRAIHRLLTEIYLTEHVHGGVREKSNYTNAKVHCKKDLVLKLDLEKYFPSISHNRVYGLFLHELKCSRDVARLLTKLNTINGQVPQGASTSTDIANLVFRKTDYRLKGLATKFGFKYTRFVDDLTFSGRNISQQFITIVKSIVRDSGFRLNDDKEELRAKNQPQVVTGLSVKFKKPRVPRKKKREWRKDKYKFDKFGLNTLSDEDRSKKELQIEGRSNYLNCIEKAG